MAQNRGSWGHFRFWPYSSFLSLSKGSVRLGWATQWLRIGVHEDSHFERRADRSPTSSTPTSYASVDWVLLYNHHDHLYDEFYKMHTRRQKLLEMERHIRRKATNVSSSIVISSRVFLCKIQYRWWLQLRLSLWWRSFSWRTIRMSYRQVTRFFRSKCWWS